MHTQLPRKAIWLSIFVDSSGVFTRCVVQLLTNESVGKLSNLEVLVLFEGDVTDRGLRHLERLKKLRYVSFHRLPAVTNEGILRLRRAFPNATIHVW
jgi:hypothetical protein